MSDTLGRFILRVPAGTSSTSNLFASSRALASGTGHIFVTSDLNHAANITATGPVFTHQGGDFFRSSQSTLGSPPQPGDVLWTPPIVDEGALNYRVTFRVDSYGASALPVLRLRCWMIAEPSGTNDVGVVLCVGASAPNSSQNYTSALTASTTGVDVDLSITLRDEDLYTVSERITLGYTASGVAVMGEPYAERLCTAWIGFANTSNSKFLPGSVRGLALSLEAP